MNEKQEHSASPTKSGPALIAGIRTVEKTGAAGVRSVASNGSMIILYPTDTLYALGVDATDAEAVLRLKELKGRDEKNPISIAVDSLEMAERYAEVTPLAKALARKFLPGKLTIVLNARNLPDALTAGGGTVGIRIPNHPQALALIHELGKPLTATSANISGMPTESTHEKIFEQFGDKASWITEVADAGELPPSEPSTVVDACGSVPIILREGAITASDIVFGPQ